MDWGRTLVNADQEPIGRMHPLTRPCFYKQKRIETAHILPIDEPTSQFHVRMHSSPQTVLIDNENIDFWCSHVFVRPGPLRHAARICVRKLVAKDDNQVNITGGQRRLVSITAFDIVGSNLSRESIFVHLDHCRLSNNFLLSTHTFSTV